MAQSVEIRVRGTVQGVGFRPTVWKLANACGLYGEVRNDAEGVLIKLSGNEPDIARFLQRLEHEAPPLARIETIETKVLANVLDFKDFKIVASISGENQTQVAPDAATCAACTEEILNPLARRYRYPFTNCTHCGPRLSIVKQVPYDRAKTTMAVFPMCVDCAREYENPADRRFHAQPIACPVCGPKVWLEGLEGQKIERNQSSQLDDLDYTSELIKQGKIVAIRGLGGFHLACDARNERTVERLREHKRRYGKPFALMARDLEAIRQFCFISDLEQSLLESPQAPIVLLNVNAQGKLPKNIAPKLNILGFMLPYTPLHFLLLKDLDFPVVMTSGNLSNEPQIISNNEARNQLKGIADFILFHDREIANRIDDSVIRVIEEKPCLLRRARGYAPNSFSLPTGFEQAPDLLAYGGELKSTFCLIKDGKAIVSQHQGDLEDLATFEDYQHNLQLYTNLYDHKPKLLVADLHPEYISNKLAQQEAKKSKLPLIEIQHHHAHIASCLAENNISLTDSPVLGIAFDGLGFGEDGTIWGGEFLLADYRNYQRLGTLKPIAMIGGTQAIREPWRNTYAHLMAALGWENLTENFADLELYQYLEQKPRQIIEQMLQKNINVPLASSCGRLFDAVAAAMGICRDQALFEGQAAIELEMMVDNNTWTQPDESLHYSFKIAPLPGTELEYVEPLPMWQAMLGDLQVKTPKSVIAARFHRGLAQAVSAMVEKLANKLAKNGLSFHKVALSGGCFQNKLLTEEVSKLVQAQGFQCLSQGKVPANDGGLALGQAAIAAARQLD
ncbi:MAG TPA: carbamoyltransferase HypF [Cyanothece sp. UBA12306]|nr:carbamoyltransferase HypF [Cyanothece sp. UBA12306]